MAHFQSNNYHVQDAGFGLTITRVSDGATCWLQGDDAQQLLGELEAADAAALPIDHCVDEYTFELE